MELQVQSSTYHKGGASEERRKILKLLSMEEMTPSRRKSVLATFNRFFDAETRVAPRRALRQQVIDKGLNAALPQVITFTDQARIETMLKQQEAKVSRRVRQFMRDVRSPAVVTQVSSLLQSRDITGVMNLVDGYVKQLGQVIPQVFTDVGISEAEALTLKIGGTDPRVAISFDPADPRAAARMKRSQLSFIREVNTAQRNVVRTALQGALTDGLGPRGAAQAFKDVVGLTATQNRAVENYRRLLEMNSSAALGRGIRDRRFDSTLRSAIAADTPLSGSTIQRMVSRYRDRYTDFRAETIARTETLRVANEARDESLRQSLKQTNTPKENVRRTWLTASDPRVRDSHDAMEGQVAGLEGFFISGDGNELQYPGDIRAPASDTINCRCVVLHDIKPPNADAKEDKDFSLEPVSAPAKPVTTGVASENPAVIAAIEAAIAKVPKSGALPTATSGDLALVGNPKGGYSIPKTKTPAPPARRPVEDFAPIQKPFEATEQINSIFSASGGDALVPIETRAFNEYTTAAYRRINKIHKTLRGEREASRAERGTIRDIDSGFEKIKLSEDIKSYRGISFDYWDKLINKASVSDTVLIEEGYSSTTMSASKARSWGGGAFDDKPGGVMEVLMPKGSKALPVQSLSRHAGEFEILIDRGAKFLVRSVDTKTRTIVVELIV